jgi:hypothetical protein
MHQRRFAGAIVADEAKALAPRQRKIDAVQSLDGAETLRDTLESDR